jgi:hypothetical protein
LCRAAPFENTDGAADGAFAKQPLFFAQSERINLFLV